MARAAQTPDLLIAGASVRAAAFSAARAGLTVAAADLFADCDLAAVADATRIDDWPGGIGEWAAGFPPDVPLMYTGGLENEPALLDRIAAVRPLAGIHGEPLRQVRTPELLQRALTASGVPAANCGIPPETATGRWLVKPRRSGGGHGIRDWDRNAESVGSDRYVQQFVEGTPGSAAFLARHDGVEFLGATDLLLPDDPPFCDRSPFAYAGSVTTNDAATGFFKRLGVCVAELGLTGLVGVDFVRTHSAGTPLCVVIEVNPRYTAGMEVLELRSSRSFVAEHLSARTRQPIARPSTVAPSVQQQYFGKRIVYAPATLQVGTLPVPAVEQIVAGRYEVADLPAGGSVIPTGAPICTVFATSPTSQECRRLLKQRESQVMGGRMWDVAR